MAKPIDLTGRRFDKLTVICQSGIIAYGGRKQSLWRCKCDCGEGIDLPSDKLPHSTGAMNAMKRAGRVPYTSCERCRVKPCALCGGAFPVSHIGKVCPLCKPINDGLRDRRWKAEHKRRYQTDPAHREAVRNVQRRWYSRNAQAIQDKRREALAAMPPEKLARWLERKRAQLRNYAAKRREQIRADPALYQKWRAEVREYYREQRRARALAELLSTSATLADKLEDTNE